MKILKTKYILFLILFLFSLQNFAQDKKKKPSASYKVASNFFYFGNYRFALNEFLKLRKQDPNNVEYNHKIGLCYIYTNIDKTKAVEYLEWVVKQDRFDPNAWYDLGRAYLYAYRIDDAKNAFNKFISLGVKDRNPIPASRQLEYCKNAEELIAKPINVTFTNLGEDVNSPEPDYNPYVVGDESFIIFGSKRDKNYGGAMDYEGFVAADVYLSQRVDNTWKKAKQLPTTINSYMIEEPVGLSADGEKLFLYFDNKIGKADIFVSEGNGANFKRPETFGDKLNSRHLESSATYSIDKKVVVFSSNRSGSKGGLDLWMIKELPTGEWCDPINLGDSINTTYNEDYPYFSPDGETLYFASTGHNSMGGYDIFKSKYNKADNTFSKPENIGYPINTPEDNTVISFSNSGRHAYIAAVRPEGFGNQDIYRITFNDIEHKKYLISGVILNIENNLFYSNYANMVDEVEAINAQMDSVFDNIDKKKKEFNDYNSELLNNLETLKKNIDNQPQITIKVVNKKDNKIQGIYRPNKYTSKYIIIIEPGDYQFTYSCDGFQDVVKDFFIHDYENNNNIEDANITLIPLFPLFNEN